MKIVQDLIDKLLLLVFLTYFLFHRLGSPWDGIIFGLLIANLVVFVFDRINSKR